MKPTLGHVFMLSLLGLFAVLGVLFYFVFSETEATLLESADRLRAAASGEIEHRVGAFLAKAPNAVHEFQRALELGTIDPRDSASVEPALVTPLMANPEITEVTLTYGEKTGFDSQGAIQLSPTPRGQWSVVRSLSPDGREKLWSRHVHQEGDGYFAERRDFAQTEHFAANPVSRESAAFSDPTAHATFTTPASEEHYGHLLPSDLHWSQLDAGLPEAQRRVEVSVQQVVTDAAGKFVGVLRVGLLTRQLDEAISSLKLTGKNQPDPHRIFLCDASGRLVTRLAPGDSVREFDDALRIMPAMLPPDVARALDEPALASITDKTATAVAGHFRLGSEDYLTTYRYLPGTQDWIVGIVVPRSFYLGALSAMRDRLLAISLGIMAVLVGGGSLILRTVKRAQAQIACESRKMNNFEFAPAPTHAPFRDVSEVLESLEQAKTAMRAMGKYVPIDLVRRLYREKSEPVLGGQDIEVSVMFTDIKDFTTLSEQLPPNQLADALGRYLDVMARVIQQETRGTIDKYIGDAIMTIWNAPEPVAEHARMACTAAVRCRDAGRALAQTPEWKDLPPFETRFGVHRGEAMVGHFGAHDRMNYTAIGDAINLASRLEGLNKEYGTSIIVSEAVVDQVREHFAFRLLDVVAVKGKTQAVRIYELLGERSCALASDQRISVYEQAFTAYLRRDFPEALRILASPDGDRPSDLLAARCRGFLEEPPPSDWNGVHVATRK